MDVYPKGMKKISQHFPEQLQERTRARFLYNGNREERKILGNKNRILDQMDQAFSDRNFPDPTGNLPNIRFRDMDKYCKATGKKPDSEQLDHRRDLTSYFLCCHIA